MPIHDVRCTKPECGVIRRDVRVEDTTIVLCPTCGSLMEWIPSKVALVGIRPRSDQAQPRPDFDDREEHTRALRQFMAREEAAGRLSAETLKLDPADLWCPEGRLHPAQEEMIEDERRSSEQDINRELAECEKGLEHVDRALHNLSPETRQEISRKLRGRDRQKAKEFAAADIKNLGQIQVRP
jgi:hypothetical protein